MPPRRPAAGPRRPFRWKRASIILLALFAAIQIVPVTRTNPPVETMVPASPEMHAVLRRSCMDCHSNETVWPWYAYVAPASWLVTHDVNSAREHMNFSTWNRLGPKERAERGQDIWQEVARGTMPLGVYTPLHPEAVLSEADKRLIEAWTKTLY
jgi:hypothetical protein